MSSELWVLGAVGIEDLPSAVRGAFTERAAAKAATAALDGAEPPEVFADQVGLDASRDLLRVERAGPFAIHPPWLDPPADAIGILIDPGHAFGSGSHATTRLALELLPTVVTAGQRVIDVGCGTGVLAIAAALLGATVHAVDPDPAAVAAALDNTARNNLGSDITVAEGSADQTTDDFDLAIVNVTIDLHEVIAPLRPQWPPTVLVSGVLQGSQLDRAAAAYDRSVLDQRADADWVAAVLG